MAADGRSLAAIDYIQQSLEDADVRKNLARGADAITRAGGQLTGRQRRVAKVSRGRRLQGQLREAVTSFGRAGAAAREAELKRQRARRRRRALVLVVVAVGGVAALIPTAKAKAQSGGQDDATAPQPTPTSPEPTAAE